MHASPEVLVLRETFQIARGAADEETVVVASFEHDGIAAHGEGAPVDYWGETPEAIRRRAGGRRRRRCSATTSSPVSACSLACAPGMARRARRWRSTASLHDWLGKRVGQPVWRLLGTERVTPPTSYTIGIDSVEGTADRTRRATGYEVLKIKVGGPGDLERLRAVRAETTARLRIDGNEGWDLDTARELMPELIELGVEFVEQPFPAQDLDAFHALPGARPPPAGADRRGLP